jgi:hypothetical protein
MLPDLQRQFIEHIFGAENDISKRISEGGFLTPVQRLQIYKNNTQLALTDILIQSFPAATKLVDEKFMRFAAHAFYRQHPPTSGDMNDYGAGFPGFLKNFQPLASHPYVADTAQLEWLRHESWMSPIGPMPNNQSTDLCLQPHVRLLHSKWPVIDLWIFALDGGDTPALDSGETFTLIHRSHDKKIIMRRLDRTAYDFLTAFEIKTPISFDAKNFLTAFLHEKIFTEAQHV